MATSFNQQNIVWKSASPTKELDQGDQSEDHSTDPINENEPKITTGYGYSDKALAMMAKMGFVEKQGLGKFHQGIVEPVATSSQQGRRGFGLKLKSLDESTFDPTKENVQLRETLEWLNGDANNSDKISSAELLESWMVEGLKKTTMHDEINFCDPSILHDVLASKTMFDNINLCEMRRARSRSNPFEAIRGSIFQNRAAVKMANMDACLDFMFTDPKDENGVSTINSGELFHFADVCAGPGGFTEYVLWRKKWQARGFGFTLRSELDFRLDTFLAGNAQCFDQYYGVNEDGNIYDPENIESLKQYVLGETGGVGVHFMMADGGFSVEGQENLQEILSKQIYLCQCLVALSIVRNKGHFVMKTFDLFTPFSVGLIYLLYQCFGQICILKPNTSRPANSERFVICKCKNDDTNIVERYLSEVNRRMWENRNTSFDIVNVVPLNVMKADILFFEYICRSNNKIGRDQILGLNKIAAFCKDTSLTEKRRQEQIRLDCLRAWKLPLNTNSCKVKPKR